MDKIVDFLQRHKRVKILEELDPFFEDLIKAELYERKINGYYSLGKTTEEDEHELMMGEFDTHSTSRNVCRTY